MNGIPDLQLLVYSGTDFLVQNFVAYFNTAFTLTVGVALFGWYVGLFTRMINRS